ncbi:hypothetical protein KUH03_03360 [Sphingobacterium sp. E70]|uniref:hypothetical protein n=1 Tax=Sphingobacterium sp. E70 TaxID=2853439 RepID=UPI00211BC369|nr:hypothetical protein [Sphingobacterium sp. E70]ULT26023.1 hypothetical protein KUH03_03360 [Sphingobacterium sp. E70]
MVTLNGADKVGKTQGYGPKSAAYLTALNTVDKQLKEIVGTIESRLNYNSERWLIVVASNRGGTYEWIQYKTIIRYIQFRSETILSFFTTINSNINLLNAWIYQTRPMMDQRSDIPVPRQVQ